MFNKLASVFICLTIVLSTAVATQQPASAISQADLDAIYGNQIFYDEFDVAPICPVGNGVFVGNSNAEITWNYLIARGMTEIQAAGFMGNFAHESGFDPTALNTKYSEAERQAFGLAQWLGGRKLTLYDFASIKGAPVDTLGLQLDYVWWELTGQEPVSGLTSSQTWTWENIQEDVPSNAGDGKSDAQILDLVEAAAISVEKHYERALGSGVPARIALALDAYANYSGSTPETSGSTLCGGGVGISPDGFAFPIVGTQAEIYWCGSSFGNCHGTAWAGTYYAYDIYAAPFAALVAVKDGTIRNPGVSKLTCPDGGQRSLWLEDDDGIWYFYQHMDVNTNLVSVGERVTAGQEIGKIGKNAYVGGQDCSNTAGHLHFAASTVQTSMYRGCSQANCPNMDKLIDMASVLKAAYDNLP